MRQARKLRGEAAVLDWLARVRVAGVEAMACGMGLSSRQVRTHVAAMEAKGLLERSRLYDGGGAVVAITPKGLGHSLRPITTRTATRSKEGLLHGRGVSWIAAHCDRREREWFGFDELKEDGWVTELIPAAGAVSRSHMPDLGFLLEGERWAAEFERMPKSSPRLHSILSGYRTAQLKGELESVLYVCATDSIARYVESVAEEVQLNRAIRSLDWLIEEAME